MKIILTENQYKKLLLEYDGSIDGFIEELESNFSNTKIGEYRQQIKSFLVNSGCQKIEFTDINGFRGASGLSLHDRVVIDRGVLNHSLEYVLYVIFHEIAHQYQYKKYGKDVAIKLYLDGITVDDGYKIMKHIENVADEFAIRKCREFVKIGLLDPRKTVKTGFYKNMADIHFKTLIIRFKNLIRSKKIKDLDKVSELIYNYVMGLLNDENMETK